jgi:hypothetical protein
MNRKLSALVLACTLFVAARAHAIPVLQIYIDGATYDPQSETWVVSASDFDLWVVGDVDAQGDILDVKLTASFFGLGPGTFTLTPGTTSTITDPSTPGAPTFFQTGTGGHPELPDHGIFNDATLNHWNDYSLGDLTLHDSPIGDYSGDLNFPDTFPDTGQVNAYHVHTTGWNKVHFDAYGHTVSQSGHESSWKTPFSHDGEVPVQQETWSRVKSLYAH